MKICCLISFCLPSIVLNLLISSFYVLISEYILHDFSLKKIVYFISPNMVSLDDYPNMSLWEKNVLCFCVLKYVINAITLGWFVMPFSSMIQFWFWFFSLANLSISNKKWLKYFNSELNYFFIQFIILLLLSYYHLLKYNGL